MEMTSLSIGALPPPLWEIEVAVAGALFVVVALIFFASPLATQCEVGDEDRIRATGVDERQAVEGDRELRGVYFDDKDKMNHLTGESNDSAYSIKLELMVAKNLIGANINGTSDPYAIITFADQKRFSSMVPGSRNPMWGEEFNFYVDELPVQIHCRWSLETISEDTSSLDIKVGTHFKKWCIMQSKIKSGAVDEYNKEVAVMLEVARSYLLNCDNDRRDASIDVANAASNPTT